MKNNNFHQLVRRFLSPKIGSTEVKYEVSGGKQSVQHLTIYGPPTETKMKESPVQTAFQTASKIIENTGDIITAPAMWLKNMQANWHIYLLATVVIFTVIAVLYCAMRFYVVRSAAKKWSPFEYAKFNNTPTSSKANLFQGQLPLSLSPGNLSIVESNTNQNQQV